MNVHLVAFLVLLAQPTPGGDDWLPLIQAGDYIAAKTKCEARLGAMDARTRAEAHKCLANVEAGLAFREADEERVDGKAVTDVRLGGLRRAAKHLDEAVALAPEDMSIHQGRLHVLRLAGLLPEMVKALEDSIRIHPTRDWLPTWKAYPGEFYTARGFEQAVLLYRVLDRHFPDDHTIISNMGAALTMLQRDAEALDCFQRAVVLAPDDPVDNWNLARLKDYMGKTDEADAAYAHALELEPNASVRNRNSCVYADFIEKKKGDRKRACEVRKAAACGGIEGCHSTPVSK
ncbi:MAG: tetratricopeptide repeat protein [Anaeromyxobacteraceae bacterium]